MSNPPPRMRFQIHLSTAIVLMFVAGGLIRANVIERDTMGWGVFGFPYTAAYWNDGWMLCYYPEMIAINAAIAFLIVLTIWFLCERLIRRRAAQKGSSAR